MPFQIARKYTAYSENDSEYAVLFVLLWVIGQAQDIVRRDMVELRQADQDICGDVSLTQFVVAVDLLGAVQVFRQVLLIQVPVLSQIPYPLVHGITSTIGYHTAFCCIDKYCILRYT